LHICSFMNLFIHHNFGILMKLNVYLGILNFGVVFRCDSKNVNKTFEFIKKWHRKPLEEITKSKLKKNIFDKRVNCRRIKRRNWWRLEWIFGIVKTRTKQQEDVGFIWKRKRFNKKIHIKSEIDDQFHKICCLSSVWFLKLKEKNWVTHFS
jgi:hypothetical protein